VNYFVLIDSITAYSGIPVIEGFVLKSYRLWVIAIYLWPFNADKHFALVVLTLWELYNPIVTKTTFRFQVLPTTWCLQFSFLGCYDLWHVTFCYTCFIVVKRANCFWRRNIFFGWFAQFKDIRRRLRTSRCLSTVLWNHDWVISNNSLTEKWSCRLLNITRLLSLYRLYVVKLNTLLWCIRVFNYPLILFKKFLR